MMTELGFILVVVTFYLAFVLWLSSAVASKTGRKPFWWIFFLGIIGAVIVVLLDIRDCLTRLDIKE